MTSRLVGNRISKMHIVVPCYMINIVCYTLYIVVSRNNKM